VKKNGAFRDPVAVHSRQAPVRADPRVQLAAFKSRATASCLALDDLLAERRASHDAVPAIK